MDPILLSIVAGCALATLAGSALTARAVAKKRRQKRASEKGPSDVPDSSKPVIEEPDEFETLPIRIGDVVQRDFLTRWPRSAVLLHHDQQIVAGVMISHEKGEELAVVCFPPPRCDLYWLTRVDLVLPPNPPGRIEIGTRLLDRVRLFPAALSTQGEGAPTLSDSGMVAFYEGPLGDAALLIVDGRKTIAYHGDQVEEGDYDVLGQVDPGHMNQE